MSDDTFGATIAKRKLSRRLTQLRQANGYTANQVCDRLDWGRGKVGRFEANTWRRPEMSDIRDLLRLYEKSEDVRQELEELAVRARERAWWRDYSDVFDNEFPGFEGDAERIRVYVPLVVPGLLQTRSFIEAYMGTDTLTGETRERAIEARLRRQAVLDRAESPPRVVAVITEAALAYHWGSTACQRGQVAHLIEMGERPNVELRMVRFADGPPPGLQGPVNIFDFPGDEPSMVFAETEFSLYEVLNTKEAEVYIDSFERTRRAAAEPAETAAYLKEYIRKLE